MLEKKLQNMSKTYVNSVVSIVNGNFICKLFQYGKKIKVTKEPFLKSTIGPFQTDDKL